MRTLKQAALLLSHAGDASGLAALAALLGFADTPEPIDAGTRASLGLPAALGDVRLATGRGALRALLVQAPGSAPLRATLAGVAASLATRTSHVLWVVLAVGGDREVGLCCWSGEARAPRPLALVVRRSEPVPSDAETVCALEAAAEGGEDVLVHARWCELLGRDALSRRFYRALEQRVAALGASLPAMPSDDRAELALLATSRLIFLSFLQAKGWLDGDRAFLVHQFDRCMRAGGGFHRRVMLPLFFGTLNTPVRARAPLARRFGQIPFLNGGLFARAAVERRHPPARFTDHALGSLFEELLGAYRFTAREDAAAWSEVAIDPEMLGRAFESLMAARERRTSGAFYTPQALVAHVVDQALAVALAGGSVSEDQVRDALSTGNVPQAAPELRRRLRALTVLDPACGSGAFLVYLLERVAHLHRAAGDERDLATLRREVLARTIHGVDVNRTAVWLCELRLWLSVVIESDETRIAAIPPLPNLDCNVRVGDALAGDAFGDPPAVVGAPTALLRLRERYVRAAGARKAPLRRALAREERQRALGAIDRQLASLTAQRRERLLARRSPDLFGERGTGDERDARVETRRMRARATALRRERRRLAEGGALPFSFPSHFGHVHGRGGFDLVVGNPPWVRLHNIPPAARASLRARYTVFRGAAWDPDGDHEPTRRFAAQVDLAALFVERGLELLRAPGASLDGGALALLVPVKLWRSLSGGGLRRLLAERTAVVRLDDWTGAPTPFDAAVYPSLVVARRRGVRHDRTSERDHPTTIAVHRGALEVAWRTSQRRLALDRADPGSPWLLLPCDVRDVFERLRAHGVPFHESGVGRAALGVKCGCNDAFMLQADPGDAHLAAVESRGRRGVLERAMLRPLLRGDAVNAWRVLPTTRSILWTHGPHGAPLAVLPDGAARWLAPWRRQLRARTDLRGAAPWWTLFRTEGAQCSRTRVVWSDFGRVPRAAILAAGDPTVPLNTCYVVGCDDPRDALAIAALLNGPVAAAWLNAMAEPARGGWHRYLAWTVGLLPIPRDWALARELLAPLAERALVGHPPTHDELLLAACAAYRLRRAQVEPLVAWSR